jgi:hypothetical protein
MISLFCEQNTVLNTSISDLSQHTALSRLSRTSQARLFTAKDYQHTTLERDLYNKVTVLICEGLMGVRLDTSCSKHPGSNFSPPTDEEWGK